MKHTLNYFDKADENTIDLKNIEVDENTYGKPIKVVKNVTIVIRKSLTSDDLDISWYKQSNSKELENPEEFDEEKDID